MEVWKDVKGYDGIYKVSSLGRVKSLNTRTRVKERTLKQSDNGAGYLVVSLYKNSKGKKYKVHQLVASAFLGHTPNGYKGLIVDHINNIKNDNRSVNLQLITARKNSSKDKKGGTSEYIGVSFDKSKRKWKSAIHVNGKSKHIGYFTSEIEASCSYQKDLQGQQKKQFQPNLNLINRYNYE